MKNKQTKISNKIVKKHMSPPRADAELQPSSVRGEEDFTADFTFELCT